jgi:hypothetical protein
MDLTEIDLLRRENAVLKLEVERLRNQLSFLSTNKRLDHGSRSETFLARLLKAETTGHTAAYDLVTSGGARLEIKSSRLLGVNEAATRRWMWGGILGAHGKKNFDWIILMGDSDERYAHHYAEPASPFVLFLLPFSDLPHWISGSGKTRYIQVTSNPDSKRASKKTKSFFNNFMVTSSFIEEKFGEIEITN